MERNTMFLCFLFAAVNFFIYFFYDLLYSLTFELTGDYVLLHRKVTHSAENQ